jgi:hypothetical protein
VYFWEWLGAETDDVESGGEKRAPSFLAQVQVTYHSVYLSSPAMPTCFIYLFLVLCFFDLPIKLNVLNQHMYIYIYCQDTRRLSIVHNRGFSRHYQWQYIFD